MDDATAVRAWEEDLARRVALKVMARWRASNPTQQAADTLAWYVLYDAPYVLGRTRDMVFAAVQALLDQEAGC